MPNRPLSADEKETLRDRLLRAVSDRCRRQILRTLSPGPLPVHDLALHLEDPTRVGYHLSVLRRAGIVRAIREDGRHVSYAYNSDSLKEIRRWFDEARIFGDDGDG